MNAVCYRLFWEKKKRPPPPALTPPPCSSPVECKAPLHGPASKCLVSSELECRISHAPVGKQTQQLEITKEFITCLCFVFVLKMDRRYPLCLSLHFLPTFFFMSHSLPCYIFSSPSPSILSYIGSLAI